MLASCVRALRQVRGRLEATMAAVEAHRDMLQRTSARTIAEQERAAKAQAAESREKAAIVGGALGL
jgi:hypothetical protein